MAMKSFYYRLFENISKIAFEAGIINKIPGAGEFSDFCFTHLWPFGDVLATPAGKIYINWHEDFIIRKTLQTYILQSGWERQTTAIFSEVVREGDVVLDLGANLGYFSLLASKLVGDGGKVFAFEPEPKNYQLLLKNIDINGYHNIIALPKAISAKSGKMSLFINANDSGSHTLHKPNSRGSFPTQIDIESVSLDDYFAGGFTSINVIKMDIEGTEPKAFLGMREILSKNPNLIIIMEFFPSIIREAGDSPEDFAHQIFEQYKFNVWLMDDYGKVKKPFKIDSASELISFTDNRTAVNLLLTRAQHYEKIV
jgi:FkbM family methyltransferase